VRFLTWAKTCQGAVVWQYELISAGVQPVPSHSSAYQNRHSQEVQSLFSFLAGFLKALAFSSKKRKAALPGLRESLPPN